MVDVISLVANHPLEDNTNRCSGSTAIPALANVSTAALISGLQLVMCRVIVTVNCVIGRFQGAPITGALPSVIWVTLMPVAHPPPTAKALPTAAILQRSTLECVNI